MLNNKDSVNGFLCLEFSEHPIIDFRNQKENLFDVSAKRFPEFSSDFIANGKFDHRQYGLCLIRIAFTFSSFEFSAFLDYQCGQLISPYQWLSNFDSLVRKNQYCDLVKNYRDKHDLVRELIGEKRNLLAELVKMKDKEIGSNAAAFGRTKDYFNIVSIKDSINAMNNFKAKEFFLLRRRTDFLQEVECNEEDFFIKGIDMELAFIKNNQEYNEEKIEVKRTTFNGSPTELANAFGYLKGLENKKGMLFLDLTNSVYARLLCNTFCKKDGGLFVEDSIRKFLNNYSGNK